MENILVLVLHECIRGGKQLSGHEPIVVQLAVSDELIELIEEGIRDVKKTVDSRIKGIDSLAWRISAHWVSNTLKKAQVFTEPGFDEDMLEEVHQAKGEILTIEDIEPRNKPLPDAECYLVVFEPDRQSVISTGGSVWLYAEYDGQDFGVPVKYLSDHAQKTWLSMYQPQIVNTISYEIASIH